MMPKTQSAIRESWLLRHQSTGSFADDDQIRRECKRSFYEELFPGEALLTFSDTDAFLVLDNNCKSLAAARGQGDSIIEA